jgi:pyruvate/2-oxoglutarate dehydrogenase complex dihydrolipoamide acyltransferase (E2) component
MSRKESSEVSEENRNRAATDPMALWRQWYEMSARLWSDMFAGSRRNYIDPYGFYRQWFKSLENTRERMGEPTHTSSMAAINPAVTPPGSVTGQIPPDARAAEAQNLWKQWFEATTNSWQKAAALGTEAVSLAPRWIEMLEQIRHNLFSAEGYPTDPLQLNTRLYNATSGPLSEFVGDIIQREEFLDASNSFMQSYTSFYKVFRRDSEKYLKNLQIPVRSDITRVAGLVVALEDKIDRLEEAFEEFEYGYAEPATAESLEAVEKRLDNLEHTLERIEGGAEGAAIAGSVNHLDDRLNAVEAKIDRLLTAFENASQNGSVQAEATQVPTQNSEEAAEEIRATAAARRKAQELGVELSEVQGTGSGGQITVDDVRRKGQS